MCNHEFVATPQSFLGAYRCQLCEMDVSADVYEYIQRLKQEIFELNRDKTAMFWKYHHQLQIVDAVLEYDSFDESGNGDMVYGSCALIIKKMQLEI